MDGLLSSWQGLQLMPSTGHFIEVGGAYGKPPPLTATLWLVQLKAKVRPWRFLLSLAKSKRKAMWIHFPFQKHPKVSLPWACMAGVLAQIRLSHSISSRGKRHKRHTRHALHSLRSRGATASWVN